MRAEPGSAQPVAIVTEVDGSARVLARGRAARLEVADPIERGDFRVAGSGAFPGARRFD
jgi:hypothetical protein